MNAFAGTDIDGITLKNITADNCTGSGAMPFFKFGADVKRANTEGLFSDGNPVELTKNSTQSN